MKEISKMSIRELKNHIVLIEVEIQNRIRAWAARWKALNDTKGKLLTELAKR